MKFLGYDGLPARVVRYVWNLFLLNVCFILSCLPVITIGAAISALYSVFLNSSVESGSIRRYFSAMKENFKQATMIWLILLPITAVLVANWYFLLSYRFDGDGLLAAISIVVTVLYLSVTSFVFALQAKFENSLWQTIKNALLLGIGKIFTGILMSLVGLFPLIMFVVDLDVFVHVIAIWIPWGYALQIQINALLLGRVFKKIQPQKQEE